MLVFDHLFKTGGTTFHSSYLPVAFAENERLVLRGFPSLNEEDQRSLIARGDDASRQLRIVAGHNAGALRLHFPDARFISVVREPVARCVSAYLHAIHHADARAVMGLGDNEAGPSLREFVERDLFADRYWSACSVHDGQARLLLGPDVHDLDDSQMRSRLFGRYVAVGLTERFDEFVFYLHVRHGLPLCLYNNRLVRTERARFEPGEDDVALARRLNTVDARLHEIVGHDFEERIQSLTAVERSTLARYVDTLRDFRERTENDEHVAIRLDGPVTSWNQARYYKSVFGALPSFSRPGAVQDEALLLDSITVGPGTESAIVDHSLRVKSNPAQWSRIGTRPWPKGARGVRIELVVESGEIGLGAHAKNSTTLISETSVGPIDEPIAVDLWPTERPGRLVIRNLAEGQSRARILSMHVVREGEASRD